MCLLTISVLTNILNHIEVKVCSEMHLSINNTFLKYEIISY